MTPDLVSAEAARRTARGWLDDGSTVVSLSAWDCLSARVLVDAGCRALVVSGSSVSASRLGLPDLGFLGLTELVPVVGALFQATGVPVLVDIDTGFGDAASAVRAAGELARAGAAGVIVEDQEFPKRCGLLEKRVVPAEEFRAKLRAMARHRPAADFLIVARTDAMAVEGLDGAIERARWFHGDGADLVYVQGPRSREEVRRVAEAIPGPKLHVIDRSRSDPGIRWAELGEWGYRWLTLASVAETAVVESLREAARRALSQDTAPAHVTGASLGALFGLDRWLRLDPTART